MDELMTKCEEKSATEPKYGELLRLFKIEDDKEYLKATRKLIQEIKSDEKLRNCPIILQCFSQLFFTNTIDTKGVVRRLLASFFNGLTDDSKTFLSVIFQGCIMSKTISTTDQGTPSSEVRQNVDILASLLENFPFGETCVMAAVVPYTNFLVKAHQHFMIKTEAATSPLLLNQAMHHCLVTEQLVNRMIQKCFIPLQEKLYVNSEDIEGVFLKLLVTNVKILLKMEDILMDCRCNASITLTLIFLLCCPDEVGLLFVSIIRNEDVSRLQIPIWLKSGIECVKESKLSTPSYLCLLFGSLSILNTETLVFEFEKNSFLLTELFLPDIMKLVQLVDNPASKVILAKLINLWTEKALGISKGIELNENLKCRLKGDSENVLNVLSYVWNSFDDSLDAVRQNARIAFDQIIKTHMELSTFEVDPWISKIIKDVLNIPWCKRGKYAPLNCLVINIGSSRLLENCPELTSRVIEHLGDHTLACYCSEFYQKMYTSHRLELSSEQLSDWFKIWVNPVIEGLCGNSKSCKNHILQYLLPKLMSFSNDILQYMIEYLSQRDSQSTGTLGALIMCLRRGRSLGLLNDEKSDKTMWCGIVHIDVLKYALCSLDEQIRLDAFSLMCENKKTSKPIKPLEFELVKLFIPKNLNNQSPSFRQHLGAYAKKFFCRIRDSQNSLIKQAEKSNKDEKSKLLAYLCEYTNFLKWLQYHLFSCLYPGAAFAMRTSCLKMLSCIIEVLFPPANRLQFSFFENMNTTHLYSILECIADTFEENKIEAFNVFTQYVKYCKHPILDIPQLKELFETCVKLSQSTRPQDSTASAYLARCLLQIEGIQDVLKDYHLDLKVLKYQPEIKSCLDHNSGYLHFSEILLVSLKDQTEFARKGLVLAAANRPIYPTIHCMRYILGDVEFKSCSGNIQWKDYFSKLVEVCLEVAEIVSPVVQDSSPEGNVPTEAIRGPGLNFDAMAQTEEDRNLILEAEKSEKTVTLMPEYLVVCCWRSIKEVSLLLGEISLRISIEDEKDGQQGLLSYDQIINIGRYFITQLLQSKHRGAFELAYAGFVMLCERLWSSPLGKLNELPLQWLDKLLEDIGTDDGTTGLCSTRRSAGIPFYVQALLGTEPEVNEHKSFNRTMGILLKLAVLESSLCSTNNPPRVHALNILKVMFKDNKLGDFVSPFISDGLIAAIEGFKSKFWSVRNSSTLLLSSLIIRIFGVKVSKEDSDLSRKNCLTGRAFFQRFPKLYDFLLEEFKAATANLSTTDGIHLHPSLYPVLMVLGRLYPSAMEGTDTNLNLAAFIPLVIKCSSSAVYKTRVMAARAIQPLVEKDRITATLVDLVQCLPNCNERISFNLVHGLLIQIKFLLDSTQELNQSVKYSVTSKVCPELEKASWLLADENKCPLVREVAFEIFDMLISMSDKDTKLSLYPVFANHLKSAIGKGVNTYPGSAKCQATIAKLAFRHFDREAIIIDFLQSDSYEVRLSVLNELKIFVSSMNHTDQILNKLLNMALHSEWHFECLGRVFDVLCLVSDCVERLQERSITYIFTCLLAKLEKERRDEVKCCIIKFTSKFVDNLYNNWTSDSLNLFNKWLHILKNHSSTEQDGDLQLAVAQIILDNADILLRDPKSILNDLCIDLWMILFDLLQEDDLDVKEVASKIYSKLKPSSYGEIQPGEALELLLLQFVEMSSQRRLLGDLATLLKLLQGEEEEEAEDERLFDKGEMNTYRDELYFIRIVSDRLSEALSEYAVSENNIQNIQPYFENTSKTLIQRLEKCSRMKISDSFTDSNNYSRNVTEICRAALFLQCSSKVNLDVKCLNNLQRRVKSLTAEGAVNNCVSSCVSAFL